MRRWDGSAPLVANGWKTLEGGVQIQFGDGSYGTGDYWTVPARTATAEVEWPQADGAPQFEARHGTAHAHAPLALVDLDADGNWTLHDDCRPLFTPLALRTRIAMVGGDGQELDPAAADHRLPYPLEVSVMNGRRPVEGARVRFAVLEGGGSLARLDGAEGGTRPSRSRPASAAWPASPGPSRRKPSAIGSRRSCSIDSASRSTRRSTSTRGSRPGESRRRPESRSTRCATDGRTLRNDGQVTLEELSGESTCCST